MASPDRSNVDYYVEDGKLKPWKTSNYVYYVKPRPKPGDIKLLQNGIEQRQPEFEQIVENGQALLDATEPGPEQDDLKTRLGETEDRWNGVKAMAGERGNVINVILPESEKYDGNSVTFSCWLMKAETKEKELAERSLPFDKTRLDKERQDIEEFEEDVNRNRPAFGRLQAANDCLLEQCDNMHVTNGVDCVDNQTKEYRARLDSLERFTSNEKERIIEVGKKLDECQERLSPIEELVRNAKKTIHEPLLFGDDEVKGKDLLEKISDLKNEFDKERPNLEVICHDFPILLEELGIQVEPVQQRFDKVKDDFNQTKSDLDKYEDTVMLQILEAEKFKQIIDNLKEWIPVVEEKSVASQPVNCDQEEIERQEKEIKALNEEIQEHKPSLEYAKASAQKLLDINQSSPHACAGITSQLNSVSMPLAELLTSLDDKQKKLDKVKDVLVKYEEVKQPFEEFVVATNVELDELAPFGLDPEEGEKQSEKLDDIVDSLDKKKQDFRSVNRAVQSLIRYVDDAERVESDLDKLSDSYYTVAERAKEKRNLTKDTVVKIKQILEIIIEIEIWIIETNTRLDDLEKPVSDQPNLKTHVEEVQAIRIELAKQTPKLRLIEDSAMQLEVIFKEQPNILSELQSKVDNVKTPVEETIPKRLDQLEDSLHSSLLSTQKQQDDADEALRWLRKMEVALASQGPLSAKSDVSQRQLTEQTAVMVELERNRPRFEEILSVNADAVDSSAGAHDMPDGLQEIRQKWNSLNAASGERKQVLEDVVPKAKEFEEVESGLNDWLDNALERMNDLDVVSVDKDELKKQDDTIEELTAEMQLKQPDYNTLINTGPLLLENCSTNTEPVEKALENAEKNWKELEDKLKMGRKKVDAMKDTLGKLDGCIAPVEEVCSAVESALSEQQPFGIDEDAADAELQRLQGNLDDLKNVEPALEDVRKAADDVVAVDDKPQNRATVKSRTDALENRHKDLKDKVFELVDGAKKAKDNAGDYNKLIDDIKKKTDELEKKAIEPIEIVADVEKIKQGLAEVEELQATANNVYSQCSQAAVLGNEIKEFNNSPEIEAQIDSELESVKKPIDDILALLDEREKKLKDQLQATGAFKDQFDDLDRRLRNFDATITQLNDRPISTKSQKIAILLSEIEAIEADIAQEDSIYNSIMDKGNSFYDSLASEEEKRAFKPQLEALSNLWQKIHNDLDEKKKSVKEVYEIATSHEDCLKDVDKWVDDVEDQVKELKPVSCDDEGLQKQCNDANAMQEKHKDKEPRYEESRKLAERLLSSCQEDLGELEAKCADAEKNWEEVSGALKERRDDVIDMRNKLKDFDQVSRYCKNQIGMFENAIESIKPFGADSKALESLCADVDKLQAQIKDLEPKVEDLEKLSDQIQDSHPQSDCQPIREEANQIREQYDRLVCAVKGKAEELPKFAEELKDLEDRAKAANDKLKNIADRVDNCQPKKLQVDEIAVQAEVLKDVEAEFEDSNPEFNDVIRCGNQLAQKGFGSEELYNNVAAVQEKRRKCASDVPELRQELEQLVADLTEVKKSVENAGEALDTIEEKMDGLKPVGSDAETINAQMEQVEDLKRELGLLQVAASQNSLLRDDIVSKHPDCDCTQIDQSINDLNERIMSANQRLSDRQGKLEEALVQCGQFNDAVQSLQRWLEETQELVDGQGPVDSADPNVLKAQIMEQKLLSKMFDDRAPSFNSLQKMGQDIVASSPDEDSVCDAKRDLEKVTLLWNSLHDEVKERKEKLDHVLPLSKAFCEKLDSANKCIGDVDAKVASDKWVPCGKKELIDKQIEDFADVLNEAADLEPLFQDVSKSAEALMVDCSPEDCDVIQTKLDALSDNCENLSEKSKQRISVLKETSELCDRFYKEHEKLNAWCDNIDGHLAEMKDNGEDIEKIKELQKEIADHKVDIDDLMEISGKLQEVVVPEQGKEIGEIVEADRSRYEGLKADIEERVRDVVMGQEKVDAFNANIDSLSNWVDDKTAEHKSLAPVAVDGDVIKEQLSRHQDYLTDMAARKPRFENLYSEGDLILLACNEEERPVLREKLEDLKHRQTQLGDRINTRQANLVEALLLSQQYSDIAKDVTNRLDRTEDLLKEIDEDKTRGLDVKKERLKGLKDGVDQLYPRMTSLKKTGNDLIGLSGPGESADAIKNQIEELEKRWEVLSNKVQDKGISIHKAADHSEEVQAKSDDLISQLHVLKDHFKSIQPIAVYEDEISKQIQRHKDTEKEIADLEPLIAESNAAIDLTCEEEQNSLLSSSLRNKQRKIENLSKFIRNAAEKRGNDLDASLDAAGKFWPGLQKLQETLLSVQASFDAEEEPRADVAAIEQLQHEHDAIRSDLDHNEDLINVLCQASPVLISNASQDDKIDVHKQLSEITEQWDAFENCWTKRKNDLEQVHEFAAQYHNELESVENWLTEEEKRFANMEAIGTRIEDVKRQLSEMRESYKNLTLKQMEITVLKQKGHSLAERIDAEDAERIAEKLDEVMERWKKLCIHCNERQQRLEEALLQLGKFSIAVDELLIWINETKVNLTDNEAPSKEKKLIEVEMAKLKVIRSDVMAHEPSVEICRKAAANLFASQQSPEEKEKLEQKLGELNTGWDEIEQLLADRLRQLNEALDHSKEFQNQVREMIGWLNEGKSFLKSKLPVGGKPETAESQLQKHNEFVKVMEDRRPGYVYIVETLEVLIRSSSLSSARILQKTLDDVKDSWGVLSLLSEKQTLKLKSALDRSSKLSEWSIEFDIWLFKAEEICACFDSPATLLVTVEEQLESLNDFTTDLDEHRVKLSEMKKLVVEITDTCNPNEAYMLNNEMRSTDDRFKVVFATVKQRKRSLEENHDLAKQFFEGIDKLTGDLKDLDGKVKAEPTVGKDKTIVRTQLKEHKELHHSLGALQPSLNRIIKNGHMLQSKGNPAEISIIEDKSMEIKTLWDEVCKLFVVRQRQLEEALIFHGMFHDAVQALEDWLNTTEPVLTTATAVMGDVETVKLLIEHHKRFESDLNSRRVNFDKVISIGEQTAKEGHVQDPVSLRKRLDALKVKWDSVCSMATTKQGRLQNALILAEEFQSGTKATLGRIGAFLELLKSQGPIVDDIDGIKKQIEEFEKLRAEMDQEEANVNTFLRKGDVILRFCHPSAVQTVRQQTSLLKRRWFDVTTWAKQRETRLREGEAVLEEEQRLIAELMQWIAIEEEMLNESETMPLPDDYDTLHKMLEELTKRQEEALSKQPEYDKVVKNAKRAPSSKKKVPSIKHPGRHHDVNGKEFLNPRVTQLAKRWQHLFLAQMERSMTLKKKLNDIRIAKASASFDWDQWKARYNTWLKESKSRVVDMWRRKDQNRDNKLTREEFVEGILETSFDTERWEADLVFNMFEKFELIDYKEFFDAVKDKNTKSKKPETVAEQIQLKIETECDRCTCKNKFKTVKVGGGKEGDQVYYFGESQKKCLVRILRSNIMVRVGGGWLSLVEFLEKHDPCRAEGRKNYQLREQLYLPEGSSQGMQSFKTRREKSSTRIRPEAGEKDKSSDSIRSTGKREPSGELHKSKANVTSFGYGRQKSDSSAKSPVSHKAFDYSSVKSSGYGTPSSRTKRVGSSDSIKREASRDSIDGRGSSEKLGRQKSGDVLQRATPPVGPRRSTSREDVEAKMASSKEAMKHRAGSKEKVTPISEKETRSDSSTKSPSPPAPRAEGSAKTPKQASAKKTKPRKSTDPSTSKTKTPAKK